MRKCKKTQINETGKWISLTSKKEQSKWKVKHIEFINEKKYKKTPISNSNKLMSNENKTKKEEEEIWNKFKGKTPLSGLENFGIIM